MTFGVLPLAVVAIFTFGAWPSFARADDLISVPGTDRGEPGSISLSTEYDGAASLRSSTALWLLSAGYDVTPRLTLGADLLLTKGSRRTTVLSPNGSFLLLNSAHGLRARGGFQNVGVRSFGEQPYVSVSQSVRSVDLVVGWTRDSGHERLMLGVQGKLNARWSGVVDWITGSGNFAAVGARYQFAEGRSLTLAFLRPNQRGGEEGLFVAYGFSLKPWAAKGCGKLATGVEEGGVNPPEGEKRGRAEPCRGADERKRGEKPGDVS